MPEASNTPASHPPRDCGQQAASGCWGFSCGEDCSREQHRALAHQQRCFAPSVPIPSGTSTRGAPVSPHSAGHCTHLGPCQAGEVTCQGLNSGGLLAGTSPVREISLFMFTLPCCGRECGCLDVSCSFLGLFFPCAWECYVDEQK